MSLMKFALTAAAAAATEQVIPTMNIVYAVISAVLLVAAAVAAFLVLRRHAANWGNALVYGLLAGVAFIALLPMLLSAFISMVPSWADYMTKNDRANQIISAVLQFVVTCLAFIVGMILFKRSSEKTHQTFDLGSGIMFGFGVYFVELFVGQQLSFLVQYIPACLSINQMGYAKAVESVVESGMTEEEAAEYLKNLASFGGIDLLYSSIAFIFKGVIETCAGALAYGLISKKMPKSIYALLIGGFAVNFGMNLLFYMISATGLVAAVAIAVFALVFTFITYRVILKYLPEEWEQFKVRKEGRTSGFPRKDNKPQKMPKINMPKE